MKTSTSQIELTEHQGTSAAKSDADGGSESCIPRRLRNIRAEPIMGLFGLGFYLPLAFVQNLVIEKICMTKYPAEVCLNKTNSTVEKETQEMAAQILLAHYLVRQLPAVVFSLFMGTWSDQYGRKFVIIVSLVGNILTYVLYVLNDYYYYEWPAEYIIWSGIPAGLTGDYASFMLGLFGFIKDISPMSELSSRISTTDGIEMLSSQLGPLIGGRLFARYRYQAVFYVGMAFHCLTMLVTWLLVHDKNFQKASLWTSIRDFFRISGFVESLRSLRKKRSDNKRAYIWAVLVTAAIIFFGLFGHGEIMYMYTRQKIEWEIQMFTYYNLALGGCQTIGSLILMPVLIRLLKLSDITFGMMGHLGFLAFYLGTALADDTLSTFLVCAFQVIAIMSVITLRSCISKCVSSNEIGKIMSMYAVLQAFSRILGQIIGTQIYIATYNTYIGAFFVMTAGLFLINLGIYGWAYVDMKKRNFVLEDPSNETEDDTKEAENNLGALANSYFTK